METFTTLGEVPNGAPGPDSARALRAAIPPDRVHEVLRAALEVILTATGPRDGSVSSLNVHQFDQAIRVFMPLGHYDRAPNQPIAVMDYKMYACRMVHRLLRQVTGKPVSVGGAYNSHLATNARAHSLYDALLEVAAEHQVPAFVQVGWSARLEQAKAQGVAQAQAETPARTQRERLAPDEVELLVQAEVARRLQVVSTAPAAPEEPPAVTPPPLSGWPALLADEGPRKVFLHLAEHGAVSEEEATAFLGSPRAYRRFALDFELHAQKVPFRVRIEATTDGKRYVKEGER